MRALVERRRCRCRDSRGRHGHCRDRRQSCRWGDRLGWRRRHCRDRRRCRLRRWRRSKRRRSRDHRRWCGQSVLPEAAHPRASTAAAQRAGGGADGRGRRRRGARSRRQRPQHLVDDIAAAQCDHHGHRCGADRRRTGRKTPSGGFGGGDGGRRRSSRPAAEAARLERLVDDVAAGIRRAPRLRTARPAAMMMLRVRSGHATPFIMWRCS